MHYTATIRDPPTPQPELFELSFEEEPSGARQDQLLEVRPQERVQRHTVEQIIFTPMLDVPVPLMEEQLLVDVFAPHDIHVPEQVVEVPKILIDELSVRTPVREPQLAGQLVEAPSIVSLTEVVRQPVEHRQHSSFAWWCAPSSRFSPRTGIQFTTGKKCEHTPHPAVGTGCGRQLVASMSLAGWGRRLATALTAARALWVRHGVWLLPPGCREARVVLAVVTLLASLLPSGIWSSHWFICGGLWKYFVLLRCGVRCSYLEIWCIVSSWPRTLQSCVLCWGVAFGVQGIGFFGKCCGAQCLARQWIRVLHQYLAFDEFRTFSTSKWTHSN